MRLFLIGWKKIFVVFKLFLTFVNCLFLRIIINVTIMTKPKLIVRLAYALDIFCLALCFVLLYLGTNKKDIPTWVLTVGAIIAFLALVASFCLFAVVRKLDRAESRRIEAEILKNAAKEDAVDKAIEDGDIEDCVVTDGEEAEDTQADYKNDDEQ